MSQTESETVPSVPVEKANTAPAEARPSFPRRVLDWYTCRRERKAALGAASLSIREKDLLARAKASLRAGDLLQVPSDPSRASIAFAQSAALYADALAWALLPPDASVADANPAVLLESSRAPVRDAGLSAESASRVSELLSTPRLALVLAERPEMEQREVAFLLKRSAFAVIDARERPLRAVDAANLKAFARVVLSLLVVGGIAAGAIALRPVKPNLAAHKPWTTSSSMFECHPEKVECGGAKTRIFFHTREENDPWFQYDLGTKKTFSSLHIENRRDGNLEDRAVPLALEASDDGVHFREIARQTAPFSNWDPTFPKVTARYVRLRALRRTILHLEDVEIYQ